jgi:hypothetical protein
LKSYVDGGAPTADHSLARVQPTQDSEARYEGLRKNSSTRVPAPINLERIARLPALASRLPD